MHEQPVKGSQLALSSMCEIKTYVDCSIHLGIVYGLEQGPHDVEDDVRWDHVHIEVPQSLVLGECEELCITYRSRG